MSSEILRRHWLSEWSTIGRRGKPFWMASWYTKLRMAGGALVTGKRTSTFLLQWVIGSPRCAGILGRVWANKFTGVVPLQYFFNTPPAQPNKYPYNNRIRFEIENNRGIHWIDNTVVVYLLKVVLHQCLIDVGARIYIFIDLKATAPEEWEALRHEWCAQWVLREFLAHRRVSSNRWGCVRTVTVKGGPCWSWSWSWSCRLPWICPVANASRP